MTITETNESMQDNRITAGDVSPDVYLMLGYFGVALGLVIRPQHRITELVEQLFGIPAMSFAWIIALVMAGIGLMVWMYKPRDQWLTLAVLPYGIWLVFTILTIVGSTTSSLSTAVQLGVAVAMLLAYTDIKGQMETVSAVVRELINENKVLRAENKLLKDKAQERQNVQ